MFALSADHKRVLARDDAKYAFLVELTTYAGKRYLSLCDHDITGGGNTYVATQNVGLRQTTPNTGIGTDQWVLTVTPSNYAWFRDSAGNWRTTDAVARVQTSLFDEANGRFLAPLHAALMRGLAKSTADDERMSITFKSVYGIPRLQNRWIMSKDAQRRRDADDGSLDNLNKRPPQQSGPIGPED